MNHHYPDNYHGGYVRGASSMQGMGYSHGGYDNPSAMARMGYPRNSYPMANYGGEGGQMHPMMQHQQQYSHSGGYMGHGGNPYPMGGGYHGYGMPGMNHAGMNASGMPMGPRGGHMMGNYYGHSHHSRQQQHPHQQQQQPQHTPAANQPPSSSYSPNGGINPSMSHGTPSQMMGAPVSSQSPSLPTPQQHPPPSAMQRSQGAVSTSTPSHTMPVSQASSSNSGYPSQGSSPQSSMMIPGASHAQSMPVAGSMSSGSSHPIPQHPMRHPTTQKSPQEVADNILQIASAYPTNQTVQVPLKGRHAPYHIPRSPHYTVSSSEVSQSSPAVNQFQQPSPASQPSPTPSTSSVKSPTPALAPIPNPIPSPGVSGIRSPSSHCLSPCGAQCSPSHMASSYSGHCQPTPSPQHYSPSGRGTPQQQHYSGFAHSPPPPTSSSSSSRTASFYPSTNEHSTFSQSNHQSLQGSFSDPHQSSSLQGGGGMTTPSHPGMSNVQQFNQQCVGNNPLMSLQKLVMLPETQVVDPKSVVNDACLASQSNENHPNSKNCEDPAERFVESSGLSVGCSGQFSSLGSQLDSLSHQDYESLSPSLLPSNDINSESANDSHGLPLLSGVEISSPTASNSYDLPHLPGSEINGASANNDSPASSRLPDNQINSPSVCDSRGLCDDAMTATSSSESDGRDWNARQEEGVSSPTRPVEISNVQCENNSLLTDSTLGLTPPYESTSSQTPISKEGDPGLSDENDNSVLSQQSSLLTSGLMMNNSESSKELPVSESENVLPDDVLRDVDSLVSKQQDSEPLLDGLETLKMEVPGPEENGDNSSKDLYSHVFTEIKTEDPLSELNQASPESKSLSVLSEVQVVVNENKVSNVGDEDERKELMKIKLRNGLKTAVRSKLSLAKKASPFVRLTTPCSIAVGADEREVCEQFAFRRNGYCHALRASRLLYSGRSRQDSTGHGDSDESVENISHNGFHELGSPQDGCKKKNITKKSDTKQLKQSNAGHTQVEHKGVVSKGRTNGSSTSNGQVSSVQDHKEVSDEDAEMCYYEGVDHTDFAMNANSSEDSFSSSQEVKPQEQGSTPVMEDNSVANSIPDPKGKKVEGCEEEVDEKDVSNSSAVTSLPAKRARKSPPLQKQPESKIQRRSGSNSAVADAGTNTVMNGIDGLNSINSKKLACDSHSSKCDGDSSELENGKIAKTRIRRRKQVFDKLHENGEAEFTEVIVKLEKPACKESSTNVETDLIDLTSSPPPEQGTSDSGKTTNVSGETVKSELNEDILPEIKVEANDTAEGSSQKFPKLNSFPNKRKRPYKKRQKKTDFSGDTGKDEDVKDSFKSMKFGKTLDLMKSQRKKEQCSTGPILRLTGDRTTPKTVSVYNQSAQNQGPSSSKVQQKSSSKPAVSNPATIHMVSNLPNDKTALVSSTKPVSQRTWACAFCNHQSSFHALGDLFGPYYKEGDLSTVEKMAAEEAKKPKEAPADKKPTPPAKKLKEAPADKKPTPPKRRKALVKKEMGPVEVWAHEACALWAPGVYVIGSRLFGMDEAMKDASESICSACKENGAMIGCLHKGCAMKYHIFCANDKGCLLDEENLSLLCPKHKDKKRGSLTASTSLVS